MNNANSTVITQIYAAEYERLEEISFRKHPSINPNVQPNEQSQTDIQSMHLNRFKDVSRNELLPRLILLPQSR